MSTRRSRTSGTERAFQIIECLVDLGEPATAYQIAKKLGAPLSTIYESIAQLERLQILTRKGGEGKFFLGHRLYLYGLAYSRVMENEDVFRLEAESLSRAANNNVQIMIRDGDYAVVAIMVDDPDQFQISMRPGTRAPLTWSAGGLLLLCSLPDEERADIYQRLKPSPSGRAFVDPDEIDCNCREAFARGYIISPAESGFAVACIAAPIFQTPGNCVAAVSMAVPEQAAKTSGHGLAKLAMRAARNIESHLGWNVRPSIDDESSRTSAAGG